MTLSAGRAPSGKVAVLLYGMLRTFEVTANSFHRHVVMPNNADVFYFGPGTSDVPTKRHNGRLDWFGNLKNNPKGLVDPVTSVNLQSFLKAYGPAIRDYRFHNIDPDEFLRQGSMVARRDWIFGLNPSRIFSMVFNIEGAVHLLQEYEAAQGLSYDAVIITRPDIAFFSPIAARVTAGFLHIPRGEGFDHWGRKHRGNARVLYYKNVQTGDFVEGGDALTFNDQIFLLSREDLPCFLNLSKAIAEYLTQGVPASPETLLYLHLCLRGGLKPIAHGEWCYQIHRAGMPVIENVTDTSMIRVVDRYHYKAKQQLRRNVLGCILRDAKILVKKFILRLTR
jgi:hypothetical protein